MKKIIKKKSNKVVNNEKRMLSPSLFILKSNFTSLVSIVARFIAIILIIIANTVLCLLTYEYNAIYGFYDLTTHYGLYLGFFMLFHFWYFIFIHVSHLYNYKHNFFSSLLKDKQKQQKVNDQLTRYITIMLLYQVMFICWAFYVFDLVQYPFLDINSQQLAYIFNGTFGDVTFQTCAAIVFFIVWVVNYFKK